MKPKRAVHKRRTYGPACIDKAVLEQGEGLGVKILTGWGVGEFGVSSKTPKPQATSVHAGGRCTPGPWSPESAALGR